MKIIIEATPEEIADLIARLQRPSGGAHTERRYIYDDKPRR